MYENMSEESNFMDLTGSLETNNAIKEPAATALGRPPRNFGKLDNLRSIEELPQKYRCIFEFPYFNIIQSNILDDVLYSDGSVVVSAPTGSGKTVVFELAIVRLLMKFEELNSVGDYKIIYVAPMKSLCHERLSDWHSKFSKIGLSCIVATGDSDNVDIKNLKNYHIIITTPEKWDSLTRNAKDTDMINSVKLFFIDEVHLLNEESRGTNLEVVVSRMKLRKKQGIRFVAVSATIPNIEDIAQWLGDGNSPAVYFKIGEELRPVKLKKIVLGYPCASENSNFKFDVTLNYKLHKVIMEYAEGKSTLIFCSTRKGVELTASHLSTSLTFHLTPDQLSALSAASSSMFSAVHKTLLSRGIGCHHAGMSLDNRLCIEGLFKSGHLPVLVATSTLAMGVNLPAHLVIIKGTKQYMGGCFQEYPETNILQMIGRAGRPKYDTSATVVIMTSMKEKNRYERMIEGKELIESNLHRHLTEHLNAEVVLGTVTDIAIALEWLRYTFLYIRVFKNPKHYNIPTNFTKNQIEKKLQDWCQIEINALNKHGMLQIDQNDGFSVLPTNMGSLMANYYLAFNTMKLFAEIEGNENLSEILMLICKCTEFSETYLRVNDKKTLNTLNRCKYQQTIRFPVKGLIKTTPMKIYCIIQAIFGCIQIQNPTLYQESLKIMRIGERISKCLVIYLLQKTKCFLALLNALTLNQCFIAKIWENSKYVARQFHKIGNVLSSMLVSAGKSDFKAILETNARDIERIINRAPPMGNEILEAVMHLPFYKIMLESSKISNFQVKITVSLLNFEDISKKCTVGSLSYMTLLIGDTENNILVCKKLFHHAMAACKEHIQYIDISLKFDHVIHVNLISENWVGIDCKQKYDIIINNDNISTKITESSGKNIDKNQKDITDYFKKTKNLSDIKEKKKSIPKNVKTNAIDTYFSKKKKNESIKKSSLGYLIPESNEKNKSNANVASKLLNNKNIAEKQNLIQNNIENNSTISKNSSNDVISQSGRVPNEISQSKKKLNILPAIPNSFDSSLDSLKTFMGHQTSHSMLKNKDNIPNSVFGQERNYYIPSDNNENKSLPDSLKNPSDPYSYEYPSNTKANDSMLNREKNYSRKSTERNNLNNFVPNEIDFISNKNIAGDFLEKSFSVCNIDKNAPEHMETILDNANETPNQENMENSKNTVTFDENLYLYTYSPDENVENTNCFNVNFELENLEGNTDKDENIKSSQNMQPYMEVFNKYLPTNEKSNKLSLQNYSKKTSVSQGDFGSFSQNLAEKFPYLSHNSRNFSQSSILPKNKLFAEEINLIDKNRLSHCSKKNTAVKTVLSQFKYTQSRKINHCKPSIRKCSKRPKKALTQANGKCFINSQISLSTVLDSSQNSRTSYSKSDITEVELQKFRQYRVNNPFENKNTSSENKNKELKLINQFRDVYPIEFCTTVLENRDKNGNINTEYENITIENNDFPEMSFEDSVVSENNEINMDKNIEKPSFPENFNDFAKNSVEKLKKSTLVNEYFNYDIGFEEFLMGPLNGNDSNSDNESSVQNEEESIRSNNQVKNEENILLEKSIFCPQNNISNIAECGTPENMTFYSQDFPVLEDITLRSLEFPLFENETFSSANLDLKNMKNKTRSSSGTIINKNLCTEELQNISFDSNLITNENTGVYENYMNSDISVGNLSFEQGTVLHNSENSDSSSQNEFSEKSNIKIENRFKIFEQYYNKPMFAKKNLHCTQASNIYPIKRQKLSASSQSSLFGLSEDRIFSERSFKNDAFVNMKPLKQIMTSYGNQDNRISLPKNHNKCSNAEPDNKIVRETTYDYTVTIYERKEERYS